MWSTDFNDYDAPPTDYYRRRQEQARRDREYSDDLYRRDRWQHEHGGFGSLPPPGWQPRYDRGDVEL